MIEADIRFSLVAGGPFYRLLRAVRLVTPGRFLPVRPAFAIIVIAWVPLMAIALAGWIASRELDPIIRDLSVHARLLIAVPLFFFAESALELHGDLAIKRFECGGFSAGSPGALERVLAKTRARRDRLAPELCLAILAWGGAIAAFAGIGSPTGWLQSEVHERGVTSAWLWYGLVALPFYQFLLGRWLWRWLNWTRVLLELARLRLRLIATHPDHSGGVVHLSSPIAAFALFVAGLSAVIAAGWYTSIKLGHAHAAKFLPALGVFVVMVEAVAFAPLLAFTRNLARTRRQGITDYGLFAMQLTSAFQRRWVGREVDDSILDRSDVSELTDLMSAYAGLQEMSLMPFNRKAPIALAAAALLPMLPLATTEVGLAQLLVKLAKALLV